MKKVNILQLIVFILLLIGSIINLLNLLIEIPFALYVCTGPLLLISVILFTIVLVKQIKSGKNKKEEFLRTMRINEYVKNTIPHKYRNYGNGNFDADKMFKDIQAHVASGNDINEFFGEVAVLYRFLDHYYQLIIYDPIVENEDFYDDGSDYSDELLLPLAERSYDILSKIQWMMDNGADPNAGGECLPLMPPVAFLDYAMTEFLLEHGANAHYSGDDEGGIPYGCGNYYIDDLDVNALNYSFEPNAKKVIFDQILKIAMLFAKYGVTDVHTHCIDIDSEKRTVSVTQASVKY